METSEELMHRVLGHIMARKNFEQEKMSLKCLFARRAEHLLKDAKVEVNTEILIQALENIPSECFASMVLFSDEVIAGKPMALVYAQKTAQHGIDCLIGTYMISMKQLTKGPNQ